MKIKLAIEWFLNPDHLPFIVGIEEGIFARHGIDIDIIESDEHYDGLDELLKGNIAFATNEPLHLIEQFDDNMLSLGSYFETKGGVLLKSSVYSKLVMGESITVTTPVSNPVTNAIGFEILRRYYAKEGVTISREQVDFVANGFEHLKYMKEGADAGWLYFYNFEGIEAQHENIDVLYLDAENAGFANFSALDIFTTKTYFLENEKSCLSFVTAVKEAIALTQKEPDKAKKHYYAYTKETPSALMDDILDATLNCFDVNFSSTFERARPILDFFREIDITTLEPSRFKTAFLD